MNKIAIISLSLILALVAGLAGCVYEQTITQTQTITIPAETVTVTDTRPLETVTKTVTKTVTQPAVTVTIPQPTVTPTTISRDQAYIMVIERLTNLAQTPEASEYLTLFLIDSSSWREYDDGLHAWGVGISPGSQGYELIQKADWFNVPNVNYFFDVHWDEPRPTWMIKDDGTIVPIGKGLMVESDIKQLNTTRSLE